MAGAGAGLVHLLLATCVLTTGGVESEQCVELAPGHVSTLSFHTELHRLPPHFWSQGVDNSKSILETILSKIKLYEKGHFKKLDEVLKGIGGQYRAAGRGEVWMDDKKSQSVAVDTSGPDVSIFCDAIDGEPLCTSTKASASHIKYNCQEAEQLYGIGYHKVYEACKADPILASYSVDWGVCLHAHYPWVDLLTSHICVMKSYNNDFIACFCSMDDSSKLESRGFCITKFECLLNNAGVDKAEKAPFQVSNDCASHVQYFMESNAKDASWFWAAQQKDNLRVRAPYHPDSPCHGVHFKGQFDIGQLDVDNIEAGIEVYTPFIQNIYNNAQNEEVQAEEEMCKPLEIDPQLQERMDDLATYFEERIYTDMLIWIPGILALYSAISEERSWAQQQVVNIIQGLVIAVGIYNVILSVLPLDMFTSYSQHYLVQLCLFGCILLVAIIIFNYKEVQDFFLKLTLICFIPDIVFWKLTTIMYTEERMFNFKLVYTLFLLLVAAWSCFNVVKIANQVYQKKKQCQSNNYPAKYGKKKKNRQARQAKQDTAGATAVKQINTKNVKPVEQRQPATTSVGQKKVGRESGSLTSALLDRTSAKGKKKVKGVTRSNSETSNSSREESDSQPMPQVKIKQPAKEVAVVRTGEVEDVKVASVAPRSLAPRPLLSWSPPPAVQKCPPMPRLPPLQPCKAKSPERRPDSLHQSHLVDCLVEQYSQDSPASSLPTQSKILTIIRENSQTEEVPQRQEASKLEGLGEGGSGFLLEPLASTKEVSNSSLVFVPGPTLESKSTKLGSPEQRATPSPTLEYKSEGAAVRPFTGVERKGEAKEVVMPVTAQAETVLSSPLARILARQLEGYSSSAVERAITEVLLYTNSEELTIPKFRDIVVSKLEGEQGIYISDDDSDTSEDGDECHICLNSLDRGLEVLRPCGHVFHHSCIASWVGRKEAEESQASCPKCRAAI